MKRLLLVVLAVLFAIPACAAPKRRPIRFGMDLGPALATLEQRKAALEFCTKLGVDYVLIHVPADDGESVDFVRTVEVALGSKIEPVVAICLDSRSAEDAVRYCEAVAGAVGGKVEYFEVRSDSPADAKMLKAAREVLRKADRDCRVIAAGIPADPELAEPIFKAGVLKYADGLSVDLRADSAVDAPKMARLRQLADKYGGKGKPIRASVPPVPSGPESDKQSATLGRICLDALAGGADEVSLPELDDDCTTPKYAVFSTMIRILRDARYARTLYVDKTTRMHVFAKDDSETAAIWCTGGSRPVTFGAGMEKVSVAGIGTTDVNAVLTPYNGRVIVTANDAPHYMICKGKFEQRLVLPNERPFQFLPPRLTISAGETNTVSVQAVNLSSSMIIGRVRIASDLVSPGEHEFSLGPAERTLMVSELRLPEDAQPGVVRIPALVSINGQTCGQLELVVDVSGS